MSAPTVTVVGAGSVGTNLATALQRVDHEVRFAARDRSSEKVVAATEALGVPVVDLAEAALGTDVVVLAVPFAAVAETVEAIGATGDTIVVDATNVVGGALPPGATSIVDVIASVAPAAVVVKAFNTIGAEAFVAPSIDGRALFLPIAGDRPAADTVAAMASSIGFDAVVVGDRTAVPLLEAHAALWIHLAFRTGLGRGFGFARMQRTEGTTG